MSQWSFLAFQEERQGIYVFDRHMLYIHKPGEIQEINNLNQKIHIYTYIYIYIHTKEKITFE